MRCQLEKRVVVVLVFVVVIVLVFGFVVVAMGRRAERLPF